MKWDFYKKGFSQKENIEWYLRKMYLFALNVMFFQCEDLSEVFQNVSWRLSH